VGKHRVDDGRESPDRFGVESAAEVPGLRSFSAAAPPLACTRLVPRRVQSRDSEAVS
jgi:hypothetical protein